MISNLLSEIESYMLWKGSKWDLLLTDPLLYDEHLTSEAKQLEIEGHKKLSSEVEERIHTDDRLPFKDPFEAVIPVLSETEKSSWIS